MAPLLLRCEGEGQEDGDPLEAKAQETHLEGEKSVKEGILLKQTSSFQRWKRRYFKLRGRTLYYAKDCKVGKVAAPAWLAGLTRVRSLRLQSLIFDEVDLSDASVAETSTKNINNSFTVITPFRKLMLCAESRKEMEDWIGALRSVQKWETYEASQFNMEHFSGMHNWYACSHARPTFCNVCREALPGVTSHGLSCEVCKFKAHKRCAVRSTNNCKWTTLASIGGDIMEDEDGVSGEGWGGRGGGGADTCVCVCVCVQVFMPHQWLEGNLPVSARCVVCDRNCGSVRRLQDWRCLWCKAIVHSSCKDQTGKVCPLGQCRVSIIPPTALNSIDSDASRAPALTFQASGKATSGSCSSPLLVLVNSKSGDNQGVKFLRKFKQLLNPAQVFDLMNGGPELGLRLFQKFVTFRILVCGGDGSVGWVLSELDKLRLHKQVGEEEEEEEEDEDEDEAEAVCVCVCVWAVPAGRAAAGHRERPGPRAGLGGPLRRRRATAADPGEAGEGHHQDAGPVHISQYADSVASHLAKILDSDQHSDVISSAKFLCGTVNEFVAEVGKAYERATENREEADAMARKVTAGARLRKRLCNRCKNQPNLPCVVAQCALLNEKLDSLVKALSEEAEAQPVLQVVPAGSLPGQEGGGPGGGGGGEAGPEAKAYRSKEQLMLRANSLKKALRQIIEQAEKVVDEQNRHTQVHRMSSSSSIRRENSEELKEAEPRECDLGGGAGSLSPASPIVLEKSEGLAAVTFSEESVLCWEKCVMNNYFGIGLDAKISLEFNNKRDEHPRKCSSRTKNMMWYGVLGTKELVQKTYKNLEQRVQLECDGVAVPLPSLQGLAVLNIPSYAGGINFWGGTKEDNNFGAPSFDDRKLEVVAVFGSMQMAVSRVINLQHHRIAQCRQVKITILGEEGVPVQVDGEAWVQPPGIVRIVHKNRAQMLTRDRAFESTLKSWEDKRKGESYRASRPRLNSQQSMEYLTEEECAQAQQLGLVADTLINRIREVAKSHKLVEQELAHAVNATALVLTEAKLSSPEHGGGDRQQQQGAAGRDQDAAGREAAGEPPLAASQEPGARRGASASLCPAGGVPGGGGAGTDPEQPERRAAEAGGHPLDLPADAGPRGGGAPGGRRHGP
ncbi:unnamed protein product [Tetraodon nigroviridis]|uniref:Diacylglycerol kinase n=1 Tax=Tetraodon nigroviridis TaxID=99883 RepID=Q4T7K6_TETNG|nr:unnamed protein product [Tetraodon nigroviridis]